MSQQIVKTHSQPVEGNPSSWLEWGIKNHAGAAELEKMMDMYFRWQQDQRMLAYQRAFASFKEEPDVIVLKSEVVSFRTSSGKTEYKFPPLDKCLKVIVPALARHGLTHQWWTEYRPINGKDELHIYCQLSHVEGGQGKPYFLPLEKDGTGSKNDHQALGSGNSYIKRYTFLGCCGIEAENQDTDARPPVPQGMFDSCKTLDDLKAAWKQAMAGKTLEEQSSIIAAKDRRKAELQQSAANKTKEFKDAFAY